LETGYLEVLPAVATYLVTTGKEAGHPEWYLEGLWYPMECWSLSSD
jgi:hypothetical protein